MLELGSFIPPSLSGTLLAKQITTSQYFRLLIPVIKLQDAPISTQATDHLCGVTLRDLTLDSIQALAGLPRTGLGAHTKACPQMVQFKHKCSKAQEQEVMSFPKGQKSGNAMYVERTRVFDCTAS